MITRVNKATASETSYLLTGNVARHAGLFADSTVAICPIGLVGGEEGEAKSNRNRY